MTKKDLRNVKSLKEKIADMELRILELDDALQRITKPTNLIPMATAKSARIEKLISLKIDLEKELCALKDEREMTAAELSEKFATSQLKAPERKVLSMRYVDCLPFRQIAEKIFMTERNVYFHHREGLRKILSDAATS